MNLKFTKMQATGNDYIFVNLFDADDFKIFNETNWSQIAIRLSDRHFGISSLEFRNFSSAGVCIT